VLYTVHFTAFCLGGEGIFFPGHGVYVPLFAPPCVTQQTSRTLNNKPRPVDARWYQITIFFCELWRILMYFIMDTIQCETTMGVTAPVRYYDV